MFNHTGTPKERAPSMRSPLLPLRGYRALADRSFFGAAVGLFCGLGMWVTPVLADDVEMLSGSTVTLRPTIHPNAVAEVFFDNRATNNGMDNRTFSLTDEGVTVTVTFTWDAMGGSNDEIEIEAPEGFIAIPNRLSILENHTGVAYIVPLEAVGM